MGLDMYLYKVDKRNQNDASELGYWRKANHIHRWFVENCQDGIDECQESIVTRENLEELLKTCMVISNPTGSTLPKYIREAIAESNLPTMEGFFFGGTDYDDDYFQDVNDTIDIVKKALDETDFEKEIIMYRSSW